MRKCEYTNKIELQYYYTKLHSSQKVSQKPFARYQGKLTSGHPILDPTATRLNSSAEI